MGNRLFNKAANFIAPWAIFLGGGLWFSVIKVMGQGLSLIPGRPGG